MKIFLGNSPWSRPGFYGVRAGSRWPHLEVDQSNYLPFPFFLAYATAILEQNGYQPRLVDGIAEKIPLKAFLYKIQQTAPDLIVLETSTPSWGYDLEVVHEIRRLMGAEPKIVLCGPNQLATEESMLQQELDIDFVIDGEYELALLELVRCLESGNPLETIDGLIFRNSDGDIIRNPSRKLNRDIDQIPWPSRHQLPMMAYYDEAGGIPQPSAQIWASRGCPYMCIFCLWPQLVYGGPNYRVRNPVDVVDEMEWLVDTYGYKSIYFDDDTFNIGKRRMIAFCDEIIRRELKIPWSIMARADTMDREILEKMVQAGLFSVKYGVESADQKILDASGKNLDVSKVRENVAITRELGIQYHLTFTFGLPGETWQTAQKTIDLALELDPHTLQFSICTPMPGSRYFNELKEKGYLSEKDFCDYTGFNSAVARTETLSPADLEEILQQAQTAWFDHCQNRLSSKDKFVMKVKDTGRKILNFIS